MICIIEWRASWMLLTNDFLFSLRWFFFSFSDLKAIICTPKLCNEKRRSTCSFTSQRPSYLFAWSIYWNTIPCSQDARALIPQITWLFMCSTGCAVQYWETTLSKLWDQNIQFVSLQRIGTVHVFRRWSFSPETKHISWSVLSPFLI